MSSFPWINLTPTQLIPTFDVSPYTSEVVLLEVNDIPQQRLIFRTLLHIG